MRNSCNIFAGKPEGNRALGRHRRRRSGIDVREMRWEVVNWIHLNQFKDQWWALMNTVMNLRVL
jgi:hypothetical protein